MLTCKELTRLTASGEMEEAGWMRRALRRLHLMMCRHCRRYVAQMREIGSRAREHLGTGTSDEAVAKRLEADLVARIPGVARPPADGGAEGE
jgi:hypothetical protein